MISTPSGFESFPDYSGTLFPNESLGISRTFQSEIPGHPQRLLAMSWSGYQSRDGSSRSRNDQEDEAAHIFDPIQQSKEVRARHEGKDLLVIFMGRSLKR